MCVADSIRRFVIIANPAAGGRRSGKLAEDVLALLQKGEARCVEAELRWTTRRDEAESIARAAVLESSPTTDERLRVVACGGDGTVQEVANALKTSRDQGGPGGILGVIPAGRCNDFASAFGIRPDPAQIAEMLVRGVTRPVDLGRVNQRYFCTVAAMGFDAAVSRFVNEMWLPLRGTLAYVYGVLRLLPRYRAPGVRLTFDDGRYDGPLFLAASANTASYGGRMRIAPDARPDDGLLDVCMVAPMRRFRVLRLLRRVMDGEHVSLPEVRVVRTRTLRIESDSTEEVWADGELVARTPVTIESAPSAVDMLVPAGGTSCT